MRPAESDAPLPRERRADNTRQGGNAIKGLKTNVPATKGGQESRTRVNDQIRAEKVRVIGEGGEQIGILTAREALQHAVEVGLDLVEISPTADPPVCRIMDYGKFRYERSKKQAEAKKKQTVIEVKEIKLRPKTEKHDLDFKINHIRKFLLNKNKVKITLRFRGREIVYADSHGREVLNKVVEALADVATVVQSPVMEGKQMIVFVAPKA